MAPQKRWKSLSTVHHEDDEPSISALRYSSSSELALGREWQRQGADALAHSCVASLDYNGLANYGSALQIQQLLAGLGPEQSAGGSLLGQGLRFATALQPLPQPRLAPALKVEYEDEEDEEDEYHTNGGGYEPDEEAGPTTSAPPMPDTALRPDTRACSKDSVKDGSKPGSKPKLRKPEGKEACPRCSSFDTKFCYYNNYNPKQPRYFCKACQRYWTAGGTLRNIAVGSGKRKNKTCTKEADKNALVELATQQGVLTSMPTPANPLSAYASSINPLLDPTRARAQGAAAAYAQQQLQALNGLKLPRMQQPQAMPYSGTLPADLSSLRGFQGFTGPAPANNGLSQRGLPQHGMDGSSRLFGSYDQLQAAQAQALQASHAAMIPQLQSLSHSHLVSEAGGAGSSDDDFLDGRGGLRHSQLNIIAALADDGSGSSPGGLPSLPSPGAGSPDNNGVLQSLLDVGLTAVEQRLAHAHALLQQNHLSLQEGAAGLSSLGMQSASLEQLQRSALLQQAAGSWPAGLLSSSALGPSAQPATMLDLNDALLHAQGSVDWLAFSTAGKGRAAVAAQLAAMQAASSAPSRGVHAAAAAQMLQAQALQAAAAQAGAWSAPGQVSPYWSPLWPYNNAYTGSYAANAAQLSAAAYTQPR